MSGISEHRPQLLVVALDGAVPSVVKALIDAGRLPAFARLAERGVWLSDCRPPFPTITPTCWSSLATGATPATHGATCQDLHLPGMKPGEVVSAYHSQNILAERFWEAAARAGKRSLIMQLPASGPAKHPNVMQIAGASCAAVRAAFPDRPTSASAPVIPSVFVDTDADSRTVSWLGETPASGQWQPSEHTAAAPDFAQGESEAASTRVRVVCTPADYAPLTWEIAVGSGEVEVETDDAPVRLRAGTWSHPFRREIVGGDGDTKRMWFRIRLFDADAKTKRLRLYITETGRPSAFASPHALGERLDEIPLVPVNHGHSVLLSSPDAREAYLEAERHNFEWQLAAWDAAAGAAGSTAGGAPPEILVVYSVYLDSLNHAFRNIVEGLVTMPDAEREAFIGFYERAYELADWFLAEALERVDESTTVLVVSDHGSVGYTSLFDPVAVLEEAGLTAVDHTEDERRIDYARSLVYPMSTCHVYVNLKGTRPGGIVDPEDYDDVVRQTIAALLGWTNETGETPVAFAVRREEAGIVGLGGERTGDVIYGIRGGRVGGHIGGVHACQIPTAVSATGDIRSIGILSGPGFARGTVYEGPVHLWDLAPTLAHALSYPVPAQAEGRVVHQVLAG